jgi:hypothetical protein
MNGVMSTDRTVHLVNEWCYVSRQLYTKKYKTLSMIVNSKLMKFVHIIKYNTRGAQIVKQIYHFTTLGAIVQNLIAQETWSQGSVHPCIIPAAIYRGY